jgi:tight adherence protein C
MDITVVGLLFILLMGAISYAGHRFYVRPGRVLARVKAEIPAEGGFGMPREERRSRKAQFTQLLDSLGRRLKPSGKQLETVRQRLYNAGYRRESDLTFFFGLRLLIAGGVGTVVIISTMGMQLLVPPFNTIVPAFGVIIGWILPGVVLDKLAARRRLSMKLALPDALDMLTVCVEAGLGFDQSLIRVAKELRRAHPQLSDELALVTLEMNAGKRRVEALRHMSERTGVAEIAKFVAVLIQTDRFGTSIGESLRTHSDYLRVSRRQEAEERANKVGVKLVFPIFFFILPAMMIVVAGPGLLQVMKQMIPMMQQFADK